MAASSDARASRISDLRLCSVITTVLRQAWLPSSNSQMTAVRGKHKFFNLVTLKKNLIHPIVWHRYHREKDCGGGSAAITEHLPGEASRYAHDHC